MPTVSPFLREKDMHISTQLKFSLYIVLDSDRVFEWSI